MQFVMSFSFLSKRCILKPEQIFNSGGKMFGIAQIQTIPEVLSAAKIIILLAAAFFLSMSLAPLVAGFLYRKKIGIKIKEKSVSGEQLTYVNKLHAHKQGTPTMGGILIWLTVLVLIFTMNWLAPWLSEISGSVFVSRLDFLSRSQTWLPLFALAMTAILGLADDYMSVKNIGGNKGGGMRFAWRLVWLFLIALAIGWWFHFKLGWDEIHLPAVGDFEIGWWYIPFLALLIVFFANASNITDGLDGLNAGILMQAFLVLGTIAFFQHRMDLAAFCGAIAGALLGFLWFNFYPARFIMGDTGAVSLGATLAVVAALLNSLFILPFLVVIYLLEALSVGIQLFSKKFFQKKVFLAAPLHHHFEAKNWPETKVTVRFWIINGIFALLGLLGGILGSGV